MVLNLARSLAPIKGLAGAAVLLSLGVAATEGLSLAMVLPLLTAILQQQASASLLTPLALSLGALLVARALLVAASSAVGALVTTSAQRNLRERILINLHQTDYATFRRLDPGSLVNTYVAQTSAYIGAIHCLLSLVTGFALLVAYAVVMLKIAPTTTLVGLIVGFLAVSFTGFGGRKSRAFSAKAVHQEELLTAHVMDDIGAMDVLRSAGATELRLKRHEALGKIWARMHVLSHLWSHTLGPVMQASIGAVCLALLAVAARFTPDSLVSELPWLITLAILVQRLLPRVAGMMQALSGLWESQPGAEQALAMAIPIEKNAESSLIAAEAVASVTSHIALGSVVGLKGQSGAGKSTLLQIIAGLLAPSLSGREILDRGHMAYLPQTPRVLAATFLENLTLGRDFAAARIDAVLETTGLASLVQNLPAGLSTRIGAGGMTLSGGEYQRLSLARMLLLEPKVLLIDEGTSALDASAEREIIERLRRVPRLTILLVAHRAETLSLCDRVLALCDGVVKLEACNA